MTDTVVTAIPLVSHLSAIVQWLFVLVVLLTGAVVLLVFRLNAVGEELRQARAAHEGFQEFAPPPPLPSDSSSDGGGGEPPAQRFGQRQERGETPAPDQR